MKILLISDTLGYIDHVAGSHLVFDRPTLLTHMVAVTQVDNRKNKLSACGAPLYCYFYFLCYILVILHDMFLSDTHLFCAFKLSIK